MSRGNCVIAIWGSMRMSLSYPLLSTVLIKILKEEKVKVLDKESMGKQREWREEEWEEGKERK